VDSDQWTVISFADAAQAVHFALFTVHLAYFVSLCDWCFRQLLQNFLNSRRPVVVFLFFVVE